MLKLSDLERFLINIKKLDDLIKENNL